MPITPVQRLTSGKGGPLSWKSYVPVVAAAEAPPAKTARPRDATSEAQTTNLRRSGEAIIFFLLSGFSCWFSRVQRARVQVPRRAATRALQRSLPIGAS